ncbi:MAG: hypothetical protein E7537_01885 [Ruminococcaceae bacterium]|nr:hypothetical protein [Oscillospiraceae bacterium]
MLQFIFGPVRSGKTTKILSIANELIQNNKKCIIIVPEQSTFETEKTVLKNFGDSAAIKFEVLSFSRLYDEITRKTGGISAKILTDSNKIILMNKALKSVSGELKVWGKYANSINFAKTMLDTIGEFKICAITSNEIKNAALYANSKTLSEKLCDLSLVYESYELLIAEHFLDPVDKLTKLFNLLEDYHYFEGKTVFIDDFKGFTGQQFKIISKIISQAENVYVSFCNKAQNFREYDVFTNIRIALKRIEKIADSHNVKIAQPLLLNETYHKSSDIKKVEQMLSSNVYEKCDDNSVLICRANTVFDEAEFTARTIRKLVREEGYRYRDFAIIVRDTENYSTAINYACEKNGVKVFSDNKLPLQNYPLSVAVLSAIKSLNFSTENILKFHKCGINLLTVDEISLLENYTYLWNINGPLWLEEWDMDTRGFVTDESSNENKIELEKINILRQKAIAPLVKFKQEFKGNAKLMSKAVINLLDNCLANEAMKDIYNNVLNSSVFTGDALKQGWDVFMGVFDSLVECLGEKSLSTTEYYDFLNLAISLEEIGVIPQTVDQVIFGQADRIRTSNIKVAFILGANQGVFPKFSENKSIFANKERKNLIDLGLDLTDNQLYTSIDENFLVYSNVCAASDKLFISYSAQTIKGEALSEASFVTNLSKQLEIKTVNEPQELNFNNLPETKLSAFSELCRRYENKQDFTTLKSALNLKDGLNDLNVEKNMISKDNAKKLYGKDIYMSASKFDTFNRCKFSYFCRYGLRLKKLQPADFDVLQRGTIVHYVLEQIISEHKENIKDFSREELNRLCDFYINQYLNLVIGYNTVKTARHEFLISKISRSLKEVVYHLSQEFAQSDFKPTHCELKIGSKDGIPLDFDFSNGKIHINGSIDRVDEYNGYIRVVDYKTGTKSFKLPDILFGLNLQMLLYLYAVIRGQNLDDKNAAGIFYMPSKRDLNNEGMAMNGLIKADMELVKAMEKENLGEFVPALSLNKDGSVSKSSTSFISEQEFTKIFNYIEKLMKKTGDSISNGEIHINPVDGRESSACDYCDFSAICGIENTTGIKVPSYKNSEVFELMGKEDIDGI